MKKTTKSIYGLLSVAALLWGRSLPATAQESIKFAGYDWTVKSGARMGPGPNSWDPHCVSVDKNGWLHLKIVHDGEQWQCAELNTTRRFGFGVFQFQTIASLDKLDKNVVLGLFTYPTTDIGPDGTNEIDIEFAHWGNSSYPIGNYTVWPVKAGKQSTFPFTFTLQGTYTTHRFTWTSRNILFQSMHGHRDDNAEEFGRWSFAPENYSAAIAQKPMRLHLNLWLFHGKPPSDGKEVEVIIKSLTFTPAH